MTTINHIDEITLTSTVEGLLITQTDSFGNDESIFIPTQYIDLFLGAINIELAGK